MEKMIAFKYIVHAKKFEKRIFPNVKACHYAENQWLSVKPGMGIKEWNEE